jgi:YlmC/YmxH family sporulation protein
VHGVRWTELANREIINLYNGHRLGPLGQADLALDEESGAIREIIVRPRRGLFDGRREFVIPWDAVRRIGPEVIIVDLEPNERQRREPREKD